MRLAADHLRLTEPVNMDQKARRRIAAKTQNLYRVLANKPASELSFFTVVLVLVVVEETGIIVGGISSFICVNNCSSSTILLLLIAKLVRLRSWALEWN